MTTLIIELPPGAYDQLRKRARQAGKPPEVLSQEILEEALQENAPFRKSARDILQAVGRLRPLGTALRRKIIPGVTLEEVRASMVKTGEPSLSEIVLTQRGDRR